MEGIITVLVGIGGYFLLVDFPDRSAKKSWRFLSEKELAFVKAKLAKDRDDVEAEPWSFKKWAASGLDPKAWGFALIFFGVVTNATGIGFFLPLILRGSMGYSIAAAQCLVAPPFAFAGVVMMTTSWVGDKYRVRGAVVAFGAMLCVVGLPIMVLGLILFFMIWSLTMILGICSVRWSPILWCFLDNRGHSFQPPGHDGLPGIYTLFSLLSRSGL